MLPSIKDAFSARGCSALQCPCLNQNENELTINFVSRRTLKSIALKMFKKHLDLLSLFTRKCHNLKMHKYLFQIECTWIVVS